MPLEYKCPNCGGKLEFDIGTQNMTCPYCDSEIDIEALRGFDEKLSEEPAEQEKVHFEQGDEWNDSNISVFTCNNCGGEIIAEENSVATHCPYCDNPVIFTGRLSGALKPDYVIPFKLTKEDAVNSLKSHFKGKPLLPKVFKTEHHLDEVRAVYVPFWLYDANVDADVTFKGKHTTTWSDSDYIYTEVSHYELVRGGGTSFQRVPADGSSKMPDDLMESLEPFDFSQAVDFQTAYLSGFLADKYDVTSEDNVERVQGRMHDSLLELLESTAGGFEGITLQSENFKFSDSKVKYALYPVYILNTTWRGKKYVFAMNGQTGKFVGNLPVSKGKFAAALAGLSVGYTAVAGAIAYFAMNYFG